MSTPLLDQLDICEPRHGGSETSIEAHERVKQSKEAARQRIMKMVQARDGYGVTVKEVASAFGYGPAIHRVSGRLSELKQRGQLEESGLKRNHASVLIEAGRGHAIGDVK